VGVRPIALGQDEGEALWFLGTLATIKAGSETTGGGVAVIEHLAPERVSTLIVHNSSYGTYVEVGHYESPQGDYACLDSTSGSPKVIALANLAGSFSCLHNPGGVTVGDNEGFRVQDGDQNGIWSYWHRDVDICESPDMQTFVTGILEDNGERLNGNDSAVARFNGLKRMNSNANWVDWTGTSIDGGESDDPGFKGCRYSDIHTRVIRNSDSC
jgi:hypothetical protein